MYVYHYSQWPALKAIQCAAKILGVESSRATYNRADIQTWRDKLQTELRASRLPAAIQELTKEMVDSTLVKALLSEADTVIEQLRKIMIVYECVLLHYAYLCSTEPPGRRELLIEARRIEAEYDAVNRSYNEVLEISQVVLDTLGRVESMQSQEVRLLLEQELGSISQRACGLINQIIMKTLASSGMSLEDIDIGHSTRGASSAVSVVQYLAGPQTLNE